MSETLNIIESEIRKLERQRESEFTEMQVKAVIEFNENKDAMTASAKSSRANKTHNIWTFDIDQISYTLSNDISHLVWKRIANNARGLLKQISDSQLMMDHPFSHWEAPGLAGSKLVIYREKNFGYLHGKLDLILPEQAEFKTYTENEQFTLPKKILQIYFFKEVLKPNNMNIVGFNNYENKNTLTVYLRDFLRNTYSVHTKVKTQD